MHKMLDVVDRNAVRLRALIEDLLVLARIEDGSLHRQLGPGGRRRGRRARR